MKEFRYRLVRRIKIILILKKSILQKFTDRVTDLVCFVSHKWVSKSRRKEIRENWVHIILYYLTRVWWDSQ